VESHAITLIITSTCHPLGLWEIKLCKSFVFSLLSAIKINLYICLGIFIEQGVYSSAFNIPRVFELSLGLSDFKPGEEDQYSNHEKYNTEINNCLSELNLFLSDRKILPNNIGRFRGI
jgi:hypothetical protein